MGDKFKWTNLIPVILVFIFGILYFTFHRHTSADNKSEVIEIIKEDFDKHKTEFQTVADFCSNTKTYSIDWQIENHPGQGLKYFSFTDFDSCKIPFAEYKRLYYKDVNPTTTPCYVPDFELLGNFESLTKPLHIGSVRTLLNKDCVSKIVCFKYEYRYFFPVDRITKLVFFPEGACLEFIKNNDKENDDLTWVIKLNDYWVIQSSADK